MRFPAKTVLIVVLGLSFSLSGCRGFASQFSSGATQKDVAEALGQPRGFHRKWLSKTETREVWVYHKQGPSIENHLYPSTNTLVFSNGKLIAKNPSNAYAPLGSHLLRSTE